ncbi:hypothetical protein Tco_0231061 [Tanacetum coccineum]
MGKGDDVYSDEGRAEGANEEDSDLLKCESSIKIGIKPSETYDYTLSKQSDLNLILELQWPLYLHIKSKECEGTSFNGQKQQRIDLNADALYNAKQENLRVWPRSSMFKRRLITADQASVFMAMMSDHNSSDLAPQRQEIQNVVPTAEKTDSSQQGLEFLFSPLLEEYYNPTHGQAEENNNDQAPNASFQEDEFINPFCTRFGFSLPTQHNMSFQFYQMDVGKPAFLKGPLKEEAYVASAEGFSDVIMPDALILAKSILEGYQFLLLGEIASSWMSKNVAAANCCGQVLWIQNQMLDYGYNFMNTKIFIDNESTIYIVKNPVFHSKTKHIKIRYHFIRDSYKNKLIQVIKIHTDHNVADLLTKALDVSRFQFLTASIGMLNL